jgi:hypothetical protein
MSLFVADALTLQREIAELEAFIETKENSVAEEKSRISAAQDEYKRQLRDINMCMSTLEKFEADTDASTHGNQHGSALLFRAKGDVGGSIYSHYDQEISTE